MRLSDLLSNTPVETIQDDDDCWGLLEVDAYEDDFSGPFRYQIVFTLVQKPDSIEEEWRPHVTQMGRSSLMPYAPTRIICTGTDTVAYCRDLAGKTRHYADEFMAEIRAKRLVEIQDGDHIEVRAAEALHEHQLVLRGASQFGPGQAPAIKQRIA